MVSKALVASCVGALLLTNSDAYIPGKRGLFLSGSYTPSASIRPSSTAISTSTGTTSTPPILSNASSLPAIASGTSNGHGTGSTRISSTLIVPGTGTGTATGPNTVVPLSTITQSTGQGTSTGTGTGIGTGTGSRRPSTTPGIPSTTPSGTGTGTTTGTGTGTGTKTATGTGTGTGTETGSTRPSSTPTIPGTEKGTGTDTGSIRPSTTASGTGTGTTTGTVTDTATGTRTNTSTGTGTGLGSISPSTIPGIPSTASSGTGTGGTTIAPLSTTFTNTATTTGTVSTPAYLLSSFVISGSITVPPQTTTESGTFSTTTLTTNTGPPNSYSATTTTGSDHHHTILPIWFNDKGFPVIVNPISITGPPGIIPPPPGFPTLDIGPDGNPTPDPNNRPSNSATETQRSQTTTGDTSTTTTTGTTTNTGSTTTTTTTSSTSSSTSTVVTGSSTIYLIIPTDSASSSDRNSFQSTLEDQVGKSNVQASANDAIGVGFWRAPLNSTQVKSFSSNPVVYYVTPDKLISLDDINDPGSDNESASDVSVRSFTPDSRGYLAKNKKDVDNLEDVPESPSINKRASPIQQKNVPKEMVIISQAKDTILDLLPDVYQYDPAGGKGITVYVVDTGATPSHPEYTNIPGTKRWLFPGFGKTPDRDQDDKWGHGTCVLSKAVGPSYGIAKNSDVVIVKLQADRKGKGFNILTSTFMDALVEIRSDIEKRNLQGKAVINFSIRVSMESSDRSLPTIRKVLKEIIDMDVPVVMASGNNAEEPGRQTVDSYPQLFAKDIPSIILVGAVDNTGATGGFSQGGDLVSVWAPGVGVNCALNTGGSQKRTGTSYSSPQVAGLIAYFMSLPANGLGAPGSGQIPINAKKLLINSASYPRKSGGDRVIWNFQNINCDSDNKKRDSSGGSCSISISGVTTTTTPGSTGTQTPTSVTTTTSVLSTGSTTPTTTTQTNTTSVPPTTTQPPTTSVPPTTKKTTTTSSLSSSLTCASSSDPSVPTGIPQPTLQKNLTDFCSDIDVSYSAIVQCDNADHGSGYMLADSSLCFPALYSFSGLYYTSAAAVWFNVSLTEGNAFIINSTACNTAMNQVLNGCPPFSAPSLDTLLKFGGSVELNNGTGGAANFAIEVRPHDYRFD
ncbi:hypothetical protein BGW36DRAFT_422075 [Talaromyces proteolyticus]|uniref:Peptidase S8/S53 domain-containing protein n=1 Tax=Talaromyces proteolyticus TaxID=1131652 RepID=A0AAD4Q6N9_9EURO|nr:uncharacterized protein BGW36DRAFT_422075 [Talaromyces proteolyticus]KAH8705522.1 hypothetical protein BGW36DRAFT_422075 [Talaromyces proteolyticus]